MNKANSLTISGQWCTCLLLAAMLTTPLIATADDSITAKDLAAHIQVLASDEFEGRKPTSNGEKLTIDYLRDVYKRIGLTPGNPDGTYFQDVPLVGITASPEMSLEIKGGKNSNTLAYGDEFMAWTKQMVAESGIDESEMIFVGYGVVAPEYDWDDYKGVDVRGKTVVMLVNDPPVPLADDSTTLDPTIFGGKAMTYYGRWTYKYEIVAKMGAKACFVIHETKPAGYPWEVVKNSWSGEQFGLESKGENQSLLDIEGWLTIEESTKLFADAGLDLATLKKAAAQRDFLPVPLNRTATVNVKNTIRTLPSKNSIAKLEGSDPELKNEYIIYCAHWDHFGRDPELEGDQIYNGALDNATGTAALLELAEAFATSDNPPKRSILFLAVTAEEQGLLGSEYYATHPLYPLLDTKAVINMDALNPFGRTKDVVNIGLGQSTLDDLVLDVATKQNRIVTPDPESEKGYFYRSDHFSFAKQGVPAMYVDAGIDFVGRDKAWGQKIRDEYTAKNYHKPSDEYDPSWDLSGAVEDIELFYAVGAQIASGESTPQWNDTSEFKAIRDAMEAAKP